MQQSFTKALCLFACAFTSSLIDLAVTASHAAPNDNFHISDEAEFYVLHKYPTLKAHKAIAVGPGGYWGYHHGAPKSAVASKLALKSCDDALRTSKFKSLARQRCVLFDVDGRRTGKAPPNGIPFGSVAEGEDRPWLFGKQWEATGKSKRGTMLLLHGCRNFAINGWQMAWVNYYRAAGFRVILPSSFADVREAERCGYAGEDGADQQTRIMKLRAAQTRRTIAGIKKKYPGEPLYLHGHSEGGFVAQVLGEKVAGIIVTGAPCGFGGSGHYWVAKGVPVLVIVGTKDRSVRKGQSAKMLSAHCRGVTGDGPLKWVSVSGMGHYSALWWDDVQNAVGSFLNIAPIRIRRSPTKDVTDPKVPADQARFYAKAAGQKAMAAADESDAWDYATGMESKLDAEEAALFGCDEWAGADVFLDADHTHKCTLVDVNGKRLGKN